MAQPLSGLGLEDMGERMLNARLGDIVLEEVDEEVSLYKDLIVDAINIFIGVVVPDEITDARYIFR